MKKDLQRIAALALVPLFLALLAYGLLRLSNSRTHQVFGGLVARVDTQDPVVALTFDDAPSPQVAPVLQTLEERGVKATFFAVGQGLEQHPDLARSIVASGHQLGNHTYSHNRMVLKTPDYISEEIERTSALIAAAGFTGPIYFRPPNGKKLLLLPWYLHRHNITTVMWDVEPDTYAGSVSPAARADFLTQYTLDHVRPGSIILMHPFCNEDCAPDRVALPKIIDALQAQGYHFVTVSELLSGAAR